MKEGDTYINRIVGEIMNEIRVLSTETRISTRNQTRSVEK